MFVSHFLAFLLCVFCLDSFRFLVYYFYCLRGTRVQLTCRSAITSWMGPHRTTTVPMVVALREEEDGGVVWVVPVPVPVPVDMAVDMA